MKGRKMNRPIKQRLRNWWWERRTLFWIHVDVCTVSIMVYINILDCKLGGELELSPIMRWLPGFVLFPGEKVWRRKIGKHKTLSCKLYSEGCLSCGFSIMKFIHCSHNQCLISLALLGASMDLEHRDVRRWDEFEHKYETVNKKK